MRPDHPKHPPDQPARMGMLVPMPAMVAFAVVVFTGHVVVMVVVLVTVIMVVVFVVRVILRQVVIAVVIAHACQHARPAGPGRAATAQPTKLRYRGVIYYNADPFPL
ncbi:MAG TPA: hypothetical protein VFI65_16930 [Streptosporangiaceae bacterium]|nr:hypothetical protein [Streptosporangiaceae bacterium]